MDCYGKKSVSNYLKYLVDLVLCSGILIFIFIIRTFMINIKEKLSFNSVVSIILFVLGSIALVVILLNLRRILNSLVISNPFIKQNVNRLKHISYSCFSITLFYLIDILFNLDKVTYMIVYYDEKGIHTDIGFFIFFFAGCFIYILSEVFRHAVDVKDENDLTI